MIIPIVKITYLNIYYKMAYKNLPIPSGYSTYALAKRAEYVQKDLNLAKYYYHRAIAEGERTESAIKDLASLLHQEGKTQEACDLLLSCQYVFRDQR